MRGKALIDRCVLPFPPQGCLTGLDVVVLAIFPSFPDIFPIIVPYFVIFNAFFFIIVPDVFLLIVIADLFFPFVNFIIIGLDIHPLVLIQWVTTSLICDRSTWVLPLLITTLRGLIRVRTLVAAL